MSARTHRSPRPDKPMLRRARAGFAAEAPGGGASVLRVTFVVADYGAERRTTVEMLPPFLHACRLFAESPAEGPLSAADLAARIPALDVGEAQKLVSLLVDVGFLRPAS